MLSARGRHRVLRVARTIADFGRHQRVSRQDVLMALSLRQRTNADRMVTV
jgi:predicted ATPase with chaperone activity